MNHRVLSLAFVILLHFASLQAVWAAKHCEDEDFQGRYVVLAGGNLINLAPYFPLPAEPFSRIALMMADGKGRVTVPFAQGNYLRGDLRGTVYGRFLRKSRLLRPFSF